MAEEIKALIEKIQQEGIQAAERRAQEIEKRAQAQANKIIEKAQADAEKILLEAKERVAKIEESSSVSLKQAGRDMILSLKKELVAMLGKLIEADLRQALQPEEMARIIMELAKQHAAAEEITISLKKQDQEVLEKRFLNKLKEATKKKIVFKSCEDINGGFIISYDAGKSHYDFTDKALAEYISACLNPRLKEILEG
ncbi:MAG: V-type ATP synthase subunit E family protein [Candidatus Omnitrophota bacterium]